MCSCVCVKKIDNPASMIIVTEEINSGTSGARNPSLGGSGGTSAGASVGAAVAAAAAEVSATAGARRASEEEHAVEFSIGSSSNEDEDSSESFLSESPG